MGDGAGVVGVFRSSSRFRLADIVDEAGVAAAGLEAGLAAAASEDLVAVAGSVVVAAARAGEENIPWPR